jgi:hypothetical protein
MRLYTHLACEERNVDALYIRLRVQKAHNIIIMVCHFVEAHRATPAGSAKIASDYRGLFQIVKRSNRFGLSWPVSNCKSAKSLRIAFVAQDTGRRLRLYIYAPGLSLGTQRQPGDELGILARRLL